MKTYRELVYFILDEIKAFSDDSDITEEHVIFLLNNYRSLLLKQRYSDIKRQIPESDYQTCKLSMEFTKADTNVYKDYIFLKSKEKIPYMIKISTPKIYTNNFYTSEITFISRERMKYVGYNKYLKNVMYASIDPNRYLCVISNNPQFKYLKELNVLGIFENPSDVFTNNIDILDEEFPLEDALISPLIELCLNNLLGVAYRPKDENNDASDGLATEMKNTVSGLRDMYKRANNSYNNGTNTTSPFEQ